MATSGVEIIRKRNIAEKLAEKTGRSLKTALAAVDFVFDTVALSVAAGRKVAIQDFGIFVKAERKARMGRNPATGEPVQIKASVKARFSAAKFLKMAMTGGKYAEHFDSTALAALAASAAAGKATAKKEVNIVAKKVAKKVVKKVAKKAAKKVVKKAACGCGCKPMAKKAAKKVAKKAAKKAAKK